MLSNEVIFFEKRAIMSSPILTPDGKYSLTGATFALVPLPPPILVPEPIIPVSALTVDMMKASWAMNHDAGTPGSATGTSVYPFTLPDGTIVRRNDFTDVKNGGFIYHASALGSSSAYNSFCYETVLSAPAPSGWSNVENLEMDLEHVYANGTYVDLAMQLAGATGFVQVTENKKWTNTKIPANPSLWQPTILYTTRLYTHDNGDGTVIYVGAYVNGVYTIIGITIGSLDAGPWAANDLNVQFQFDGKSAGSVESIVDIHLMKIHMWKI